MKMLTLFLCMSFSMTAMDHNHFEAENNGTRVVLDIESAPGLPRDRSDSSAIPSRSIPAVQLSTDEVKSDNAKIKLALIAGGVSVCTAVVTAAVTIAATYGGCRKD